MLEIVEFRERTGPIAMHAHNERVLQVAPSVHLFHKLPQIVWRERARFLFELRVIEALHRKLRSLVADFVDQKHVGKRSFAEPTLQIQRSARANIQSSCIERRLPLGGHNQKSALSWASQLRQGLRL